MPDNLRDEQDCRELYARVWQLLEQHGNGDPSLINIEREPTMFALRRNGLLLVYALGAGKRIAEVTFTPAPNPDRDEPNVLRVTRSTSNPAMFQLGRRQEADLAGVAGDIVGTFLRRSEPAQ